MHKLWKGQWNTENFYDERDVRNYETNLNLILKLLDCYNETLCGYEILAFILKMIGRTQFNISLSHVSQCYAS